MTKPLLCVGDPLALGRARYFELLAEFPQVEPIVSMITFKDRALVATSRRVYEIRGGTLYPLDIIGPEVKNPLPTQIL